jgi:DNA polymerase (family 10)
MIDKRSVAQVLEQIAAFMQLKGENAFRVRAFTNAARVVNGFPEELDVALANGSLAAARGIGPVTHQIVAELMKTGRSQPAGRVAGADSPRPVEMLEIPGLGVAKIRQIHDVLGIDSIPDLEAAARTAGSPSCRVSVPRPPTTCSRVSDSCARPAGSG